MINIYITEESALQELNKNGYGWSCLTPEFIDLMEINCCRLKEYRQFSNKQTFEDNIRAIMSKMLLSNSDTINLLIINAHGADHKNINRKDKGSGAIEVNEKESIDLRKYSPYFETLPAHLVVLLSICQGAFPGPYQAFEYGYPRPIIIAPVVSMLCEHLEKFYPKLIETLKQTSDNEDEIFKLVVNFNNDSNIKESYPNDVKEEDYPDPEEYRDLEYFKYAMGMFKRSGEWYPKQGIIYRPLI